MAEAKLGVEGRPRGGDETRLAPPGLEYIEPGRASLEGERPPGGRGECERGGKDEEEPVYFFWVNVREKMACDRDD